MLTSNEHCVIDQQQKAARVMDSTAVTPESVLDSNSGKQHVKFLCSFLGTILPRPQDGKLRYVGGETRIVCVPRDITYVELMGKMRELFEGVVVLRYQQPGEDLDAIVSVMDDDDVTNMMEEYDKSGSGDRFTRLRLFLFGHPAQDSVTHFGDGDERDNEKRYMAALNSLNESTDFRRLTGESPEKGCFDDFHSGERYSNQMNLSNSTISHFDSGQFQQVVAQRYNETEATWSPAYYSPRRHGSTDQRHAFEYPSSPSSSQYQMPYGGFSERGYDKMHFNRPPINFHSLYEHQPPNTDNFLVVHAPTVNEIAGFPGNIHQKPNYYEGNNVCDHCRMAFHRSPVYPDSSWKPDDQPHVEPSNAGNGYLHAPNSCAEYPPNRESCFLSSDANLHSPYYRDQNDHRFMHPEVPGQERRWVAPIKPNPWPEEPVQHLSVSGRLPDCYSTENGTMIPLRHGNARDGHHVQSHYLHPDDQRYACAGVDYGNQVIQDQVVASGPQVHLPSAEGQGLCYGNPAYVYQMPHGHVPSPTIWRNDHSPLPGDPSYDTSVSTQLVTGPVPMGYIRSAVEVSPRVRNLENRNHWADTPDCSHVLGRFAPNTLESHHPKQAEPIQSASFPVSSSVSQNSQPKSVPASSADDKFPMVPALEGGSSVDIGSTKSVLVDVNHAYEGSEDTSNKRDAKICFFNGTNDQNSDVVAPSKVIELNVHEVAVENGGGLEVRETNSSILDKQPNDKLEFLPEQISSVKEEASQDLKEVKEKAEQIDLTSEQKDAAIETYQIPKDGVDGNVKSELDNDNDVKPSKIEPTKAEAEALERGLQTIKNEDLEEIRELGSGTYGAVYHGKWKGSDVAIKRIKASCFAGKPSERERLIADFWKEALTLSSLHHPNVVSFYGVVRDGPDGSLATVTEFMVNGSLKQFLQKKDRTIDRRKRLIIAMDTAFGMEYLHGKNIVHFDLKCENLLVNMRDPHRPVCKIGDLGLSKVKHHSLVSGGVRGTLPWMAPELLSGKSNMVTEKIDVYSFGIVMWELLTGDEPYADMHYASIIGGIVNNTLRLQIPSWCDPEWKSLMESCWGADPAQRPSFTEISQRLRNMAAAMNLK